MTRCESAGAPGLSCQVAEHPRIGAETDAPFDYVSGDPSVAQIFILAASAPATHLFYDGLSVTVDSNFRIHARTLQHFSHALFRASVHVASDTGDRGYVEYLD